MDPAAPKSAGGSRGSGRGPSPCSPREPPPLSCGWQGRCQGPTWTEGGRGSLGQCGHPPRLCPARTHHMPVAAQRDEDVAALMDQQFAVDAPVALPGKAPYPFTALATVRSLHGTRTAAVRGPRHAARTCCTVTTRTWGGRRPCRLIQPGPGPAQARQLRPKVGGTEGPKEGAGALLLVREKGRPRQAGVRRPLHGQRPLCLQGLEWES